MSSAEPAARAGLRNTEPGLVLVQVLRAPATAIVLLALAVLQQCLGHHNADNSWLISVAESLMKGARPYVDLIETNPPGAFLIYLPGVALARLLHLPSELVVSALIFAGTLPLLLWCRRMLVRAGALDPQDAALFLNAGIFALLALPSFSFGEREHLAAICVLPIVSLYVVRAGGTSVSLPDALGAGLLAATAVIAKPHFVLAVLLPFAWLLWRRRRPSLLFAPEHCMAVAVCALYLASLPFAFPHFFEVLPAILDVYVPVRSPWLKVLGAPWFLLSLVLIGAVLAGCRGNARSPLVQALLCASAGFVITYVVQVKGWVNHGLPGVSLAFLAAAVGMAPALRDLVSGRPDSAAWQRLRRPALFLLLPALFGAPVLFGSLIQFSGWEEYPGLAAAVRRHAPAHPRIATLTGDLDLGHPLVRSVDGIWSQRPHSLWLMTGAMTLLNLNPAAENADRLKEYVARDARQFREDIAANRPDVIVVASPEDLGAVLRHPDIRMALAAYRPVETLGSLTLYGRQD